MVRSRMVLVPHDPAWIEWYEAESVRLRRVLDDIGLEFEHIGSTAVPGLIAKPVIDLAVVVASTDDFDRCVAPLESLGYRYRGQHGDDALRRYFVLEQEGMRVAQLHVWAAHSPSWREALAFRDLLRSRADLRAAYAGEKLRVAEAVRWDKSRYSVRKGTFIEGVLGSAGLR